MGWSSMSFPLSSYLPSSTMNAVFSNFASLAAQESGAPAIDSLFQLDVASGIRAPQASSFGVLDIHSQYTLNGNIAKALIQSIFAQVTSQYPFTAANVFSTYMVASITPKFSDSTIIIHGTVSGLIQGASTIEFNLARAPNGAPILLTQSVAPGNIGALSAANLTVGQTPFFTLPLVYQEPSPGSGTATQYGLRGAANQASGYPYLGQLLVQEWR